jgi:hypothetical protein
VGAVRRGCLFAAAVLLLPAAAAGGQASPAPLHLLGPQMFATGTTSAASPQAVAVAPLEGPSRPLDVVVANQGDNSVSVLRGSGDGSFSRLAEVPVGRGPSAVVGEDIDGNALDLGNGSADVAVANTSSSSVSILLGNGSGAFTAGQVVSGVPSPSAIVAADFNRDGRLDLAVADETTSGAVTLLLGHGDGTFAAAGGSPFQVGDQPVSLAAGDFNEDGQLDLVTANAGGSDASLLLGNGQGGFAPAVSVPVGLAPKAVAVGHVNQGDDHDDLVLVLRGSNKSPQYENEVAVLLGNGSGGFTAEPLVGKTSAHPTSVALADLDGDHNLDVVAGSGDSAQASVLLGDGTGDFKVVQNGKGKLGKGKVGLIAAGRAPYGVAIADLDGDGRPDLVFADNNENGITVELGRGGGKFDDAPTTRVGGEPVALTVGDLDGKSGPDVATALTNQPGVSVLIGKGDGSFASSVTYPVGEKKLTGIAFGDLTGDGIPDLAAASAAGSNLWLLQGTGNGSFATPATPIAVGTAPHGVAIADLTTRTNGGPDDLVTTDFGSATDPGSVSVLLNHGDGTFVRHAYSTGLQHPLGLAVADFDGDGYRDLAVTYYGSDRITVFTNDGAGNPGQFDQTATYPVGITPVAVAAGTLTTGGRLPDLVVANQGGSKTPAHSSISVLLNNGHGLFTVEPSIEGTSLGVGYGPQGVAISDLNHDGNPDIAVADAGGPKATPDCHVRTGPAGGVTVLLGNGSGTSFTAGPSYASLNDACGVAAADLDGDGWDDLVVPAARSAAVETYLNSATG